MAVRAATLMAVWCSLAANSPDHPAKCSASSLSGRYVFAGQGIIEPIEPGIQRMHYGQFVFDGRGKLVGKQSSSRGGKIGREDLEGSYVLDQDCSGSMTFRFLNKPDTDTHWDMYVTDDGRMGHIIRIDQGSMAVRTFQK
jgi:hypothetical protein